MVVEQENSQRQVVSQTWETVENNDFVAPIEEFKSKWYFRVPLDCKKVKTESYTSDDGISFITPKELTFAEAAEKIGELNALAYIPVLD